MSWFSRFFSSPAGSPPGTTFLVLHDLERAREVIAEALAAADDRTRPGLTDADGLLAGLAVDRDRLAGTWALRTLRAAGLDPAADKVAVVRELRRVEPGLSLVAAVRLQQLARQSADS